MGRFFDYDNPILKTIGKIGDVVYLSAFWLLCSLPIFTIGASTTALYYALNKVVRHNRGYSWSEFFQSFKANFKQSTIIWLVVLGIYLIGIADCYFARILFDTVPLAKVLFLFFVVLIFFVTMWVVYLFPYVARFGNTTQAILKNCALIAIANFPKTFLLFLLFVISLIVFLIVPFGMMFVPGIYMILANRILEPVFRKYMSPEDLKAEELRNSEYIQDTFGDETKEDYSTECEKV